MTEKITMGVSVGTFENRLKKLLTEDTLNTEFKAGEYRGKVGNGKFYMFISEDGPKNNTVVLSGKYDDKAVNYKFTKPKPSIIMVSVASVIWLIFSIVSFFMYGPIGFVWLLAIPVTCIPMFRTKNEHKEQLVKKLRQLALKLD